MKLLDSARRARLPWESLDSISEIGQRNTGSLSLIAENDPPEMIHRCLTCPRPDCTECMSIRNTKRHADDGLEGQIDFWGD